MEIGDNNLDNLFRKKTLAEGDEPLFDEAAWHLMERKLNKRQRVMFFQRTSVVLLLIGFLGFGAYFLNTNVGDFETNKISKIEKLKVKKGSNIDDNILDKNNKVVSKNKIELINDQKTAIENQTSNSKKLHANIQNINSKKIKNITSKSNRELNNEAIAYQTNLASKQASNLEHKSIDGLYQTIENEIAQTNTAREEVIDVEPKELVVASVNPQIKKTLFIKPLPKSDGKALVKKEQGIKWGFAFSVGPENNTVNGFGSGKTTLNGGVLLQASFKDKWILSSGLVYGIKNYDANAQQYQFANPPRFPIDNILASCDVLEIPLRASYQISKQKNGSFYLNTGLSTLFMIKEQYTYEYNPSANLPNRVILKNNANQHLFGILEISTTYQFKLKSKSNLGISPYVKLPLNGIGEGEVNLKSTGINLNYNYEFNKKKK